MIFVLHGSARIERHLWLAQVQEEAIQKIYSSIQVWLPDKETYILQGSNLLAKTHQD